MSKTETETPNEVVLEPPEEFALAAPAPVSVVPVQSASGKVRLKPEDVAELEAQIRSFIDEISALDSQDTKFKEAIERIHNLGNREIEASSSVSNRMLDKPVKTLKAGFFDNGSDIGKGLIDLRRTIEDLDPSRQGDLFSGRKLLGVIPLGNKLGNYFDRYQSSQSHINAIIEALKRGKDGKHRHVHEDDEIAFGKGHGDQGGEAAPRHDHQDAEKRRGNAEHLSKRNAVAKNQRSGSHNEDRDQRIEHRDVQGTRVLQADILQCAEDRATRDSQPQQDNPVSLDGRPVPLQVRTRHRPEHQRRDQPAHGGNPKRRHMPLDGAAEQVIA